MINHINDEAEDYLARKEIALIRYGYIAPVITDTLPEGESAEDYYRRLENETIAYPDGTARRYRAGTFRYWTFLFRHGGTDALMPRARSDRGSSRRLSEEAKEKIRDLVKEFPKITGTMVWSRLHDGGYFDEEEVSVDTVQRFIKNSGLRGMAEPAKKEKKAWEFACSLDGWEADTAHTLYVTDEEGKKRKTYLIAIIDDHSRVVVGARFFFADNAVSFQKVWKQAVMRYGRSRVLILDNGSPYKNGSTRLIASKLGTRLIYCRPYSPTEKSKIERLFLNVRNSWLNICRGDDYHGIDELNEKLDIWVAEYNRHEHSALRDDENGCRTPMQRFMHDMKGIEPHMTANIPAPEYQGWLDECFLHEETRKVSGDSTVKVLNVSYDVPSQYIARKVLIRYDPSSPENVFLDDPAAGKRYHLKRTDRVENSRTRRTEILY